MSARKGLSFPRRWESRQQLNIERPVWIPTFVGMTALILLTFALISCEGEPGAPGVGQLPFDRYPPTAEIILPLAGKPLQALTTVEISTADDDTVVRQQFLVNGLPADSMFTFRRAPSLYYWDASSLPIGRNTLQLRAWDRAGKVGESALLLFDRTDDPGPEEDVLFYCDSAATITSRWTLPADSLGNFIGLGTRFTPDRPCLLRRIGVKIFKKTAWTTGFRPEASLVVEVYSEKDGRPDSLLTRKILLPRLLESGEVNLYYEVSRMSINFDREFFALVTFNAGQPGDSISIQTDGGGWANGHGLIKYEGRDWEPFTSVRGKKPNPLIYAVVSY